MTETYVAKPDHNALGKAAFVTGLIGLLMSFIPLIGFVAWLLGPIAILLGLIALRRPSRSLAIVGVITGLLALLVCVMWVKGTQSVGQAMNKDTFNTTGNVADLSTAPIIKTTIKGLWKELEENKIAAGQKYGGHRLAFTDETIEDFSGDGANPAMQFAGKTGEFMTELVSASFAQSDGVRLGAMKKGQKVSFICEKISEGFGDGYSLSDCKLS